MPIYTVHAPDGAPATAATAERIALVKDGFVKSAFVFGPLWLISQRLWRALAGWALAEAAILVATFALGLTPVAAAMLNFLLALYLGVEGGALQAAGLARRGYRIVDVAVAPDEDAGERAFFARWRETGAAPGPLPAGPAPRARAGEVLGLFPEPGART